MIHAYNVHAQEQEQTDLKEGVTGDRSYGSVDESLLCSFAKAKATTTQQVHSLEQIIRTREKVCRVEICHRWG
jgi:hypothetical protein